MRSYLGLIPQYEKAHRKNNRISVLCITLSVCLVMAIFSMADMAIRSQKNYFIKTNGEYHVALHINNRWFIISCQLGKLFVQCRCIFLLLYHGERVLVDSVYWHSMPTMSWYLSDRTHGTSYAQSCGPVRLPYIA